MCTENLTGSQVKVCLLVTTTRREYVTVNPPPPSMPQGLVHETNKSVYNSQTSARTDLRPEILIPKPVNLPLPAAEIRPQIRETRLSHNTPENKTMPKFMRVRRYSCNQDGTKQLIGEEEVPYDPKKPPSRQATPIPQIVPSPSIQPQANMNLKPTAPAPLPPRPMNAIQKDPAIPIQNQLPPSLPRATSAPRLNTQINTPPSIQRPAPAVEQQFQSRQPRVTVTKGAPIVRRDLSPGVDSQFLYADKYSNFKPGDVIETVYKEAEPGIIIEETLRKTETNVRKEKRNVAANGEFVGIFQVQPLSLDTPVQNRSGKTLRNYITKIPEQKREASPSPLPVIPNKDLKVETVKPPAQAQPAFNSKETRNQKQEQPENLKTALAQPAGDPRQNQRYIKDEAIPQDDHFYLESMEFKDIQKLPKTANQLRMPDSGQTKTGGNNLPIQKEVKPTLPKPGQQETFRIAANTGQPNNPPYNPRQQGAMTFESAMSDPYLPPQTFTNSPSPMTSEKGKVDFPDPRMGNDASRIKNQGDQKKQPLRLVFQIIEGKRVPVAIENEDMSELEKKAIIENYLKKEGLTKYQIEELLNKRSRSPSPVPAQLSQNPFQQQSPTRPDSRRDPRESQSGQKTDLLDFIQKSLEVPESQQAKPPPTIGQYQKQPGVPTFGLDAKRNEVMKEASELVVIPRTVSSISNVIASQHNRPEVSHIESYFRDMPDLSSPEHSADIKPLSQMPGQPMTPKLANERQAQRQDQASRRFEQSSQAAIRQQDEFSRQGQSRQLESRQQWETSSRSKQSNMGQMNFDDFGDWHDDHQRPGMSMMKSRPALDLGTSSNQAVTMNQGQPLGYSGQQSYAYSRTADNLSKNTSSMNSIGKPAYADPYVESNKSSFQKISYRQQESQKSLAGRAGTDPAEQRMEFEKKITSNESSLSVDPNSMRNMQLAAFTTPSPPPIERSQVRPSPQTQAPVQDARKERSKSPPGKPLAKLPSTKKAQMRIKRDITGNSQLLQIAEEEDDAFKYHSSFMQEEDQDSPGSPVIVEVNKQDLEDDYYDAGAREAAERRQFGLESKMGGYSKQEAASRYYEGQQGARNPGALYGDSTYQGVNNQQRSQLEQPQRRKEGLDRLHFESQMKESYNNSMAGSRMQSGAGFGESAFGNFSGSMMNQSAMGTSSVSRNQGYRPPENNFNDPYQDYQNQTSQPIMKGHNSYISKNSIPQSPSQQTSSQGKQSGAQGRQFSYNQSNYSREDDFNSQLMDHGTSHQKPVDSRASKMSASGVSRGNRAPVGFSAFGSVQSVSSIHLVSNGWFERGRFCCLQRVAGIF